MFLMSQFTYVYIVYQQAIVIRVIFNGFPFHLHARVVSNLPTTSTILEYSEFNYTFSFTSEFYTFIYFHVTN